MSNAMGRALRSLIAIYRRDAPQLATMDGVPYPAELAATVLQRLAEVSALPPERSGTPAALVGAAHDR